MPEIPPTAKVRRTVDYSYRGRSEAIILPPARQPRPYTGPLDGYIKFCHD